SEQADGGTSGMGTAPHDHPDGVARPEAGGLAEGGEPLQTGEPEAKPAEQPEQPVGQQPQEEQKPEPTPTPPTEAPAGGGTTSDQGKATDNRDDEPQEAPQKLPELPIVKGLVDNVVRSFAENPLQIGQSVF